MKTAHCISRLLFLSISILPFQPAPASPPGPGYPETLVVTQFGLVKPRGELDGSDIALTVIPFTSTDNGTLTVGPHLAPCGMGFVSSIGYGSGAYGSYSPTGLTGGGTVLSISDVQRVGSCPIGNMSVFSIELSTNPGSSWLSSITCNGVKNTDASAGFTYSNNLAQWAWSTLFGLSGKSTVSCSIVHN